MSDESISDYWRPDEGALILHDPRFNASLMGAGTSTQNFPAAGRHDFLPLLSLARGHPHRAKEPRLSVAANFSLTYRNVPAYERRHRFSC